MNLLPFFFFIVLPSISSLYPHAANAKLHDNLTDHASLLVFKDQVVDPTGVLSANWTTNTAYCSWIGITCSPQHQRVAALNLTSIPLQGTLSPHLANLSFLMVLDLRKTMLTGSIPSTLTQLPRLRYLNLGGNSLTGPIPSNLFNMSSLIGIHLSSNNLTGSLPSEDSVSGKTLLEDVFIAGNQLTGQVPSYFARFPKLQYLSLSSNKLTGTLPRGLGNLKELVELDLSSNQLGEKIPASFGNLPKLQYLSISGNNLEGNIPAELGNLSNLQWLQLCGNRLTGSIPLALLNASMIEVVELCSNRLTGPIPAALGMSWPLLQCLHLYNNSLSGDLSFITSLSNCGELDNLALSGNELGGFLPSSIGNLSLNLLHFNVAGNRFKGTIPAGLGNLSGLLDFDLGNNELTGEVPVELTRLTRLQGMILQYNRISGSIPPEIGKMTGLNSLSLEANQLSGPIPDSLGNLTGLQNLYLGANKLTSTIPEHFWNIGGLIELNLSQNAIYGTIPHEVDRLQDLYMLDLSKNQLSGNITSALGELKMLRYLDLSHNSLQGHIPESFGGLININFLNLSNNLISGIIPICIANLTQLSCLDLSFNKMEGQIPQGRVFSNTSIPSLEGNADLCGARQLHLQPCTANLAVSSQLGWILRLLKYILPAFAFVVGVGSLFFILIIRRPPRKMRTLSCTDSSCPGDWGVISYHDLVLATDNFSKDNLLGRGSIGSVFKGYLNDGLIVAVKVLNMEMEGAWKSFEAECRALCSARHRNLIKIITVCSNFDFKALILQYMLNGSLEQWLHSEKYCLDMLQRLNILVDVSSAMEYLHHHHPEVILHCDLKPSNVLLDEEMVAYVSDFGIARMLVGDTRSVASASTNGTIGYIAPECGATGQVSKMGDVYSFGILLLETFTGKRPTDVMFGGESTLREFVSKAFPLALLDVIDEDLLKQCSLSEEQVKGETAMNQCLSSVMELGLLCSSYLAKERVSMIEVVHRMQKIKEAYLSRLSCT